MQESATNSHGIGASSLYILWINIEMYKLSQTAIFDKLRYHKIIVYTDLTNTMISHTLLSSNNTTDPSTILLDSYKKGHSSINALKRLFHSVATCCYFTSYHSTLLLAGKGNPGFQYATHAFQIIST